MTAFRQTSFRAGHGHAGVLLVLSLVYYDYLDRTTLAEGLQWAACVALVVGVLAQSGGFFLHLAVGEPGRPSAGTRLTTAGALLLTAAIMVLVYALIADDQG